MPSRPPAIWTLGHSRHPIERFVGLAEAHGVSMIADVRGQPFSRFNPQFNRERFAVSLDRAGIGYRWFGEALSGRPKDPDVIGPDGTVDWGRVRAKPGFARDIDRLIGLAETERLALVCAEEDPLKCHRRFLVTAALIERGVTVGHIRGDARIETEAALSDRAAPKRRNDQPDLFGRR